MNPEPILKLIDIKKSFTGNTVLCDINFELYPGEVHCLVGENGAGKSTLIKIISGAYEAEEGKLIYQGKEFTHYPPKWAIENGINTIYQEIDLVPNLTGAQNICLGDEPVDKFGNMDHEKINTGARQIIDEMGVDIDLTIPVGELKIAQQQMVAIASALWLKSKVIILDEPTAVFTRSEIDILFEIINRLKSQNIAVLYISHHLNEIFEMGDRVTVLRDGRQITSGCIDQFNKQLIIKAMVGREIEFHHRNGACSETVETILRVESLSRDGDFRDISFKVCPGEIVGIAGLVGAGRTELARCLVGMEKIDSGSVFYKDQEKRIRNPNHALYLGIGLLPESRKEEGLILVRPMGENIGYSLIEKKANLLGFINWSRIKSTVTGLINSFEIRPNNPLVQTQFLSGGNQQKVVFARLLAAKCDFLILDEPTRGVDVGARSAIYELMQKLKSQEKGILMISSDMPELLTQADRIIIMAKGRISGELIAKEATEEQILSYALQLNESQTV